uniref:Serpentine Receptor, class H n=1 Tax=Caenorhabditis tropicalis TaxID=1561998 RepID=A0A1I7TSX1_9PELO
MNSVKWTMFNLHFWSVLMDIGFTVFTCPFMLLPAMAGFPLGLDVTLGVPVVLAVYVLMTLFTIVGISTVSIFENRFFLLFASRSSWKFVRYPFLLIDYILALICFIPPLLNIPDQKDAIEILEKKYRDIPIRIYSEQLFIMSINHLYILISMSSISGLIIIETFTFGILISKNLKRNSATMVLSKNTVKLQKKFMRALIIQILTPVLILFVPASYLVFSISQYYYSQIANNLCMFVISLHGCTSTVVMLYMHEPYRKYCSGWLFRNVHSEISNVSFFSK